jgi:uncharacterized membrane protein
LLREASEQDIKAKIKLHNAAHEQYSARVVEEWKDPHGICYVVQQWIPDYETVICPRTGIYYYQAGWNEIEYYYNTDIDFARKNAIEKAEKVWDFYKKRQQWKEQHTEDEVIAIFNKY